MFNCAVKIISWFLLVVDSLAPKCPNQTEKLKTRMLSISHQDKMLAITSKVDICTKRCTSCSRCIFNSNLSHQEVERDDGDDIKSKQSCEMANWRSSPTTGCSLRHLETFPSIFIASTLGTREVRPSKQVF